MPIPPMLAPDMPATRAADAPLAAADVFLNTIKRPARLLIAVSGGSDSTGLLLAVQDCLQRSARFDITLHAVTVDHGLRLESAQEAQAVADLCAGLDIPHHIRRWDGDKPVSGLSAAARHARYQLIGDLAEEIGADAILMGHTHGDQLETIAMRASRSGREDNLGRAGMADAVLYRGRNWFMRPFLGITRDAIRDYLCEKRQPWIDDPSNDDTRYERVRTRRQLGHDSDISEAAAWREDVSRRAAGWIDAHMDAHGACVARVDPAGFKADQAVLRYGLSALAAVFGGRPFGMPSQTMDRVIALVMEDKPGRMTGGRVMFDRRKDALYLFRENRTIAALTLPPGTCGIWDDRFEVINRRSETVTVRPCMGAIDEAVLPFSLPPGIVKRALLAFPCLHPAGDASPALSLPEVMVRPMLAPYDLFLPRFDLALACRIAGLLQRVPYPQPLI